MFKVKKILTAAAFVATLVGPQVVAAQAIVVLKAEQAMFATQKAIALGQQMSAQLKPQATRFDAMGKEWQALQARLEADKDLMSGEEVQQLQIKIQSLGAEYKQLQQYLSNTKLQAEQDFLTAMRPALDNVLRQLIEENDISLIINGQSVIYNAATIDITPRVIELLNLEP